MSEHFENCRTCKYTHEKREAMPCSRCIKNEMYTSHYKRHSVYEYLLEQEKNNVKIERE